MGHSLFRLFFVYTKLLQLVRYRFNQIVFLKLVLLLDTFYSIGAFINSTETFFFLECSIVLDSATLLISFLPRVLLLGLFAVLLL